MVNCPQCGKPLKKDKTKYSCENIACSVIFVRHPNQKSIMQIVYESKGQKIIDRLRQR